MHNQGRRPVNLVEAGIQYHNGKGTIYDERSPEFPMWLFSRDGFSLCFKIIEVIKELKSYDTEISYGYFTEETGKIYKTTLSDEDAEHIKKLVTDFWRKANRTQ